MARQSVKVLSPFIVGHTGKKCTASVILLHGSGATAEDIRSSFHTTLGEELQFPHIRFIYPTAPVRRYTLAGGLPSTIWFDRLTLGLEGKEQLGSVDAMANHLGQLIEEEIHSGIPIHRILIGGFSMGGAMALYLGYRFYPKVAGVLAMSCFLYEDCSVYKYLETRDHSTPIPPLQQLHGEDDDLVLYDWGRATHNKLQSLGVKGEFVSFPNLTHMINAGMAKSAREWIAKMLPEDEVLG
ncbi:lysophospholipase-like protein 1 [Babylonia areolata]|uniref:lysophospholipase-like protein 1 n=1 Tax=Babylonia areolata TaxID=304850 RepID=UPI003FD00D12